MLRGRCQSRIRAATLPSPLQTAAYAPSKESVVALTIEPGSLPRGQRPPFPWGPGDMVHPPFRQHSGLGHISGQKQNVRVGLRSAPPRNRQRVERVSIGKPAGADADGEVPDVVAWPGFQSRLWQGAGRPLFPPACESSLSRPPVGPLMATGLLDDPVRLRADNR
jgi:hypothetical protein